MHPDAPPFGLLLDVDGPIASPVTRSISAAGLLDSLLELLAAGIPVVFNTGRSDDFLRTQVVGPILAAGLPARARLHAVCEKGAVTFTVTAAGMGPVEVDEQVAVPGPAVERLEALAREHYADVVFVDGGKRAMVSLEQRLDVDSATYLARQPEFEEAALAVFADLDLGATWKGVDQPDSAGRVDWRIDPTIISTDIESVLLGKDRGAEMALRLLATDGPPPTAWRTVGDSRTDYAMADWLHAQGHVVAHVDVRPADGVPTTPYPVLQPRHTVNDLAGAAWLARLAAVVRGDTPDDLDFDTPRP